MNLTIKKSNPAFKATINLPGSKSISNRALMIRAYAQVDRMSIEKLSEADDTRILLKNLRQIRGCSHSNIPMVIDCGNAGTVFRFLVSLLASSPGTWLLTGTERMKARPVADLVDALKHLGASIEYAEQQGFPPLIIHGKVLTGGISAVSMQKSSQFASSLVLAAPTWKNGLELHLEGTLSSMPYLKMSLEMMRRFGAKVIENERIIHILPVNYKKNNFVVESDWSSAAFWYELVALSEKGELLLKGLTYESLQGDSAMITMFRKLGVESFQEPDGVLIFKTGVFARKPHFDLQDYPDMLPSLVACCAGLGIEASFSGLENLQFKESDRTAALQNEMKKMGVIFEKLSAGEYKLHASNVSRNNMNILFDTYKDHRMAMAFAPLALVTDRLTVAEAEVVEKSYPTFWDELKACGAVEIETLSAGSEKK